MKKADFWDVTPRGSYKDRSFGGMYRLLHQGNKNRRGRNNVNSNKQTEALVTANVVPNSPILVTLIMQAIRSSETSILTRATQRNILEDRICQSIISWLNRLAFC
jgi:hypothetical protein